MTAAAGHTDCTPEVFYQAVAAGVTHVCHLFDGGRFGREVWDGVARFSLADVCLLDNRVTLELIMDGFHVPEPLVKLAVRCAERDRIVAVTDSLQGAGLPNGKYRDEAGMEYYLDNDSVCRLTVPPYQIAGSGLTMVKAFHNLVRKFGFSLPDASRTLSYNPSRAIGTDREMDCSRRACWRTSTFWTASPLRFWNPSSAAKRPAGGDPSFHGIKRMRFFNGAARPACAVRAVWHPTVFQSE